MKAGDVQEQEIDQLLRSEKGMSKSPLQLVHPWQEKIANQNWMKRLWLFWGMLGFLFFFIQFLVIAFFTIGVSLTATLLYMTNFFQAEEPWFGNKVSDYFAVIAFVIWCFVLAIFLLPQFKLHGLMVNVKRHKLKRFAQHLEVAMNRAMEEPSDENIERVDKLHMIHRWLHEMSVWPFETKAFAALFTTIVVPIIIAILERILFV